jgi:ATP-dependent RNA helicase DDX47/RRP3
MMHSGKSALFVGMNMGIQASIRLSIVLRNLGFAAIPLHGQLSQSQRLGSLSKFQSGSKRILVATDVASR